MTRPHAIPERDDAVPPHWLLGIGLLATTTLDAAAVATILARIRAPGWLNVGGDAARCGWIEREPDYLALMGLRFTNRIPMEQYGEGWMVIRIDAGDGSEGCRLDVRGEVDAAMEEGVSAAMQALGAVLLRHWDPVARRAARSTIPLEMRPRARLRRKPPVSHPMTTPERR